MIGSGFGKTQRAGYPDSDVGMLDVSANALAVLILATMLLITVAAPPSPRGEVRASERPDLFYPSPLDLPVPPQSAYWVVTGAGLTRLDLDAFAEGLAGGASVTRTDQGEATLIIDRRNYRDLNDHRLHLSLDLGALSQTAIPIGSAEDLSRASEEIRREFEQAGILPTFLIMPDSIEVFAPVYWHLRTGEVAMRWTAISDGRLILSRRVDDFETRRRGWQ
jgi:hypothetical protein